jgi:fatty-acyl-CoA synthase
MSFDQGEIESAAAVADLECADPWSLLPGRTIHEALSAAAKRHPNKAAIIHLRTVQDDAPVTLDYAAYLSLTERAANLFREVSTGGPAVVAVIAPFLPETLIAMWGGATAGRYVPINPFLELEHVAGIMRAAEATVLVAAAPVYGLGVCNRLTELQALVPSLKRTYQIDAEPGADDFALALAAQPEGLTFQPETTLDADCACLHTGGTTATPKLVRHTHGGQLLQGWLCGMSMGAEPDAVVGHAMPNFHVGGAVAVGVRGIVFGQTLLSLTPAGFRNADLVPAFWSLVERFGMTSITTAPTTAAAIFASGGEGPGTLQHYTTGGGPLSPDLARAFHQRFGLHLREVWGGTEFHGILSFHYGGAVAPRLGSCGRTVPFHQVLPAILEDEQFVRLAEPGERAVLIASGPTLSPGFVDTAANKGLFLQGGPDLGQWATTGDIGTVDEDSFIWIYGREKDVIIRGGHNIDSALIDDALLAHPAVLNVAAVGKPCPSKGELPMAYVQLRPGESATEAELLDFARARIQERAAIPVEILIVDEIPLTAVGKVSKPPLRIDALRRVAQQIAGPDFPVTIAEKGGRLTVVVACPEVAAADRLRQAFAPYTFATRLTHPATEQA